MVPLNYDSGPGTKVLLLGLLSGAVATFFDLIVFIILAAMLFLSH